MLNAEPILLFVQTTKSG